MTAIVPIFRLGRFIFSLSGSDSALIEELESLFEHTAVKAAEKDVHILNFDDIPSITPNWKRHQLENGKIEHVRIVTLRAMEHHLGLMWLDAAILVTPTKQTVLISGDTHAGKSTVALALSIGYGWKIVTEDVALIDLEQKKAIVFASPLSIRAGTTERVKNAIAVEVPPLIVDKWIVPHSLAATEDPSAHFSSVFHLNYTDPSCPEIFECTEMPISSYVRQILRISNLIQLDAAGLFHDCVAEATFHQIGGGSLSDRLSAIINIAQKNTSGYFQSNEP